MAVLDEIRRRSDNTEEELLREWYERQMQQELGRSLSDLRSAGPSDLKASFSAWFDHQGLSAAICESWDYCRKRKQYQDPSLLAAALADMLLALGGIAAPINVALLMVKYSFDKMCKCDQSSA